MSKPVVEEPEPRLTKIKQSAQEKYKKILQDTKASLKKLNQELDVIGTLQGDRADYQTLENQWQKVLEARQQYAELSHGFNEMENYLRDAFRAANVTMDPQGLQDVKNEILAPMNVEGIVKKIEALDERYEYEQEAIVQSGIRDILSKIVKLQEVAGENVQAARTKIDTAGEGEDPGIAKERSYVYQTLEQLEKQSQEFSANLERMLSEKLGIDSHDIRLQGWREQGNSIISNQISRLETQLMEFEMLDKAAYKLEKIKKFENELYKAMDDGMFDKKAHILAERMEIYSKKVDKMADAIVGNFDTTFGPDDPQYRKHSQLVFSYRVRLNELRKSLQGHMNPRGEFRQGEIEQHIERLMRKPEYQGLIDMDTRNRIAREVTSYTNSLIDEDLQPILSATSRVEESMQLAREADAQIKQIINAELTNIKNNYSSLITDITRMQERMEALQDKPLEERSQTEEQKMLEELSVLNERMKKYAIDDRWRYVNCDMAIDQFLVKGLQPGENYDKVMKAAANGLKKKYQYNEQYMRLSEGFQKQIKSAFAELEVISKNLQQQRLDESQAQQLQAQSQRKAPRKAQVQSAPSSLQAQVPISNPPTSPASNMAEQLTRVMKQGTEGAKTIEKQNTGLQTNTQPGAAIITQQRAEQQQATQKISVTSLPQAVVQATVEQNNPYKTMVDKARSNFPRFEEDLMQRNSFDRILGANSPGEELTKIYLEKYAESNKDYNQRNKNRNNQIGSIADKFAAFQKEPNQDNFNALKKQIENVKDDIGFAFNSALKKICTDLIDNINKIKPPSSAKPR